MPFFDSLLSVIAPHDCLGCGWEGSLLCQVCSSKLPGVSHETCFGCGNNNATGLLCDTCRPDSSLLAVRARTTHKGLAKQLVHQLKFERAQAAAKPMAQAMAELLPRLPERASRTLVVPVPTASSRVRLRGYDQAALLARLIAKHRSLPFKNLLGRTTQTRQVGASREQRRAQLKNTFYVRQKAPCEGATVILVDDVMTTGASLEAAAHALKEAGARRVLGLVFARQE